jgi:hypothetical protein
VDQQNDTFLLSRSEINNDCTKAHNLQYVSYSSVLNIMTLRDEIAAKLRLVSDHGYSVTYWQGEGNLGCAIKKKIKNKILNS